MLKELSPELKEKFVSQFGRVRELFPRSNDYTKYNLVSYDPNQGMAHFEDSAGRSGQVVDYILLVSQQTRTIARREIQTFGFGQNSSILSAEVTYTAGNLRTRYELDYDSRSGADKPDHATIGVDYITDEVTSTSVDLTDGIYHEDGKLTGVYIAFGDPESLAKYYEEERRIMFGTGVIACFPSRPGVHLKQEEGSTVWVLKDSSFLGREIERIKLGTTVAPKEVKPYSYRITPKRQQLEFNRTCTACEGEWNFAFPTNMDLQTLDTLLKGERWVETIKRFPFAPDLKDGTIIPCPSDVEEQDETTRSNMGKPELKDDVATPAERKLPNTPEEVERMVKEGKLKELPNGLIIFPPATC